MNNCSDKSNGTINLCFNMNNIHVVQWIIIGTGLPLILVAIFAVFSLVKKDQPAPVFVINLFMSDLIQLCCMIAENSGQKNAIIHYIYFYGLMVSTGFMVCVSLERYLVIAWPLWYRFRRNIKTSAGVSAVAWATPLVFVFSLYFKLGLQVTLTICGVFLILPLPVFIFFLTGTLRALSAARSVPEEEKRRIVAILVVVLLNYTLLFLPFIIWSLVEDVTNQMFFDVTFILISFSPLADLTMYVLIRKSVIDNLLASLCCCNMSNKQQVSDVSNDSPEASLSQTV